MISRWYMMIDRRNGNTYQFMCCAFLLLTTTLNIGKSWEMYIMIVYFYNIWYLFDFLSLDELALPGYLLTWKMQKAQRTKGASPLEVDIVKIDT